MSSYQSKSLGGLGPLGGGSKGQKTEMPTRADETKEPVKEQGPHRAGEWISIPGAPAPLHPQTLGSLLGPREGGGKLVKGRSHAPGPPSAPTILLLTVYK